MFFFIKIFFSTLFFIISLIKFAHANEEIDDFNLWLTSFKKHAQEEGVSKETIDRTFSNVRFMSNVIKYDRKQPEFYEDTLTYVSKRANNRRILKARKLLKQNKNLLDEIEKKFKVEKELLLALWGIETNFGKHVGKMDIISSLATLSFDKRRSEFFSSQLIILLKLIDKNLVNSNILFGSWAGAYGNFQFMPSTIKNYAIDYNKDNKIELKDSLEDSFASAANYINKIGWNMNEPCFYRVTNTKKIELKYLNFSARNIKNKLTVSKWKKKGVVMQDGSNLATNLKSALIRPDNKDGTPIYIVFENYEKILKWNRSLRFGISVCTLAGKI